MYLAMDMKSRSYDMSSRLEAKTATRDAILEAGVAAAMAERSLDITLAAIAERAGVTVKTVLRHFGSREALVEATISRALADAVDERTPSSDDPADALTVLIEHYDRRGDMVLAVLAAEDADPANRQLADTGRLAHRQWIEAVYGPRLPTGGRERTRVIDALVVATDVYAWKLLRRDRRLSATDVHDRMVLMTEAITDRRREST